MAAATTRIDDAGIHFSEGFGGPADVTFDGHRIWSFSVEPATSNPVSITWPKTLKRLLDGHAEVAIVTKKGEVFSTHVAFGSADTPLKFVDRLGNPIMIDKWGFIQRPFETRRAAGVVAAMTEKSLEILTVMRESCGIEGWISFGTLLGAARAGRAIDHDSDIDLCYLSEHETPARMSEELFGIGRALSRAGLRVQHRSGSFLTVRFQAPDGAVGSIDVYTTFYLDGLLHETATVRAPVPRAAVLPLREIEFEDRMLPAPADPAALLAVSYGPSWEHPDPSFKHRPGPEITQRFDGWFGSLMRNRRDWLHHNVQIVAAGAEPSDFARWVVGQLEPGVRVVDIGSGSGIDVAHYADAGFSALGLDYALPAGRNRQIPQNAHVAPLNLYDLRDVLTRGALLARHPGPQVICARGVLETLDPDGLEYFWDLLSMSLRAGGRVFLEGRAFSPRHAREWTLKHGTGRLRQLAPQAVEEDLRRSGGRVLERWGFGEADPGVGAGRGAQWRMMAEWPSRAGTEQPG